MTLKINENLDPAKLAKEFKPKGRIQILDFMPNQQAEKVYTSLATETPWRFTYNDGDDVHKLSPQDLQKMISRRQQELAANIYNRAREQFQFVFQDYPISENFEKKVNPDIFLNDVHTFLNSKEFLGFAEKVTGVKKLSKAETQGVFFTKEQFHTQNDGQDGNEKNVVGFHYGLTKGWQPNWCGYHNFFDENGNVELGLKPEFNALTLFKLPQTQSIAHIPPYPGTARMGIHGHLQID